MPSLSPRTCSAPANGRTSRYSRTRSERHRAPHSDQLSQSIDVPSPGRRPRHNRQLSHVPVPVWSGSTKYRRWSSYPHHQGRAVLRPRRKLPQKRCPAMHQRNRTTFRYRRHPPRCSKKTCCYSSSSKTAADRSTRAIASSSASEPAPASAPENASSISVASVAGNCCANASIVLPDNHRLSYHQST